MSNTGPTNPNRDPSDPLAWSAQPGQERLARVEELLIDRATIGLAAAEQAELQLLMHELGLKSEEGFDRIAAALDLALRPAPSTSSAMPADVYQRLLAKGEAWCAELADPLAFQRLPDELPSLTADIDFNPPPVAIKIDVRRRVLRSWPAWGGWVAAAASLTFAALVSTRPTASAPAPVSMAMSPAPVLPAPTVIAAGLPSPVEAFDALVSNVRSIFRVPAETVASSEVENVDAEFVWDPAAGRGFLAVAGLPPTDESRQYQVWIQDASRAEPQPVDAGLFEIASEGPRWVIPIEAKLPVTRPTLFAVTVERLGGVVVSSPERVVLTGHIIQPDEMHGPPEPAEAAVAR